MAQEERKRAITSGILSYFKPLKESLENELSGSILASELKSLYFLQLLCSGAGERQNGGAGSCGFSLAQGKWDVIIEYSQPWDLKHLGSDSDRALSTVESNN